MRIEKIQASTGIISTEQNSGAKNSEKIKQKENHKYVYNSLEAMAVNNLSFMSRHNSQIGLSSEELEIRTSKEYLMKKVMLGVNSPEYSNLEEGDKKALIHLVKAAKIIDEIALMQDNSKNIAFRDDLKRKSREGDLNAKKTLRLFYAQRGIMAGDFEGKQVILKKGEKETLGKGFFPADLKPEEFNSIIQKMIKEEKYNQVEQLLSQRTVVKRTKDGLTAVDYTKEYEKEFQKAADELEKAAKTSTNEDFNEYLILQAQALRTKNPYSDAKADIKWATLQDTPLEFTLIRECYADNMTKSLTKETKKLLDENDIVYNTKDSLGARVGIVNKEGTEDLLDIKKYLPMMAKAMPLADTYEQAISSNSKDEIKQTMVDADIVYLAGHAAESRGGFLIAENLPNNDKLAIQLGGGRRNVFHRQARMCFDPEITDKKLNAILNPELKKYDSPWGRHQFTIAHENVHSLGPIINKSSLGKYCDLMEENKADVGAIALLNVLIDEGKYNEEEAKQIITSSVVSFVRKAMPPETRAHRVKEVIQLNYLLEKGAISIDEDGILDIDFDKTIKASKEMLKDIIKVQLSEDQDVAKAYSDKYFVWSDDIERIAKNLRKADNVLNNEIVQPLGEKLSKEEG